MSADANLWRLWGSSYLVVKPAALVSTAYELHGILLLGGDESRLFNQNAWNAAPASHKMRVHGALAERRRLGSRDEKRLALFTMRLVPAVVHHADRLNQLHLRRDIFFGDLGIIHFCADAQFLRVPTLIPMLVLIHVPIILLWACSFAGIREVVTAHLFSRQLWRPVFVLINLHCRPWLRNHCTASHLCLCTSLWRWRVSPASDRKHAPAR